MSHPYDAGIKPLQRAEHAIYEIERNWGFMTEEDFNPVPLALQLMDSRSTGRSYHEFMRYFDTLDDSLKDIVDEYYQGFNNSIMSFGEIKDKLTETQDTVKEVQGGISKTSQSLGQDKSSLGQLYYKCMQHNEMIKVLDQIDGLKKISTDVEELSGKKQYLQSVRRLLDGLEAINSDELRQIGALADLREQLTKEKTLIHEVIIEELSNHIYLKSPYCERKMGVAFQDDSEEVNPTTKAGRRAARNERTTDGDENPEADSFGYVDMLINSLVLLNRVEDSVTTIRERIPVELHYLVDRVIGEVEERYKAGLQTTAAAATTTGAVTAAGSSNDAATGTVVPVTKSILTPGRRMQTQEILEDFVTTLYARFGSVLEYHKFVLETIGRLSRRPSNSGSGPGIAARRPGPAYALREVWMTIQSEIKSMLYDYLTTECAASRPDHGVAPAPAPTPSPGLVRDRANRRISGGTKVPGGGWLEDLIRSKATGSAQGAAAADGNSASAAAGNVGATPSGVRQVFSFGQSEIKSTSEALYKPIEDEMRQLLSFTKSEGAQQQQQQQLVAQSAVVDRFAEGNGAAGHLLLVPPSVYHASVVLSPTTQFLARIGHVLLEPRDTQDFDEFLRHFFVRFFLPQVEAHALHLFTQMTSGSDAFYTHPTLVYRGRPVIKSAVAIVPLIHDLGRMLAAIPFYQEEYVMIVEKIIRKYFDECQTRFTEAITNSKYVVGAFGTAMLMASAGGGGNNPYPLDAMGGSGNGGLSAHTAMMSSSSAAATSTSSPHTTAQNDRAGPARQCIASRWANDDDLQQLLDMKFRLTLHDRTVKFDTRSEKEMAIEYRLKHDRSIHPSELMFDVKKMNFLATLHHSLEWFLLNVHFSRMSQVPLGGEVVDSEGGGDGVGNDGGANGTRVGAADGESTLDAADGNRLDLDMLAQMKGLRVRLDQLWDRHRTLATSCLVTLRIEMRCRCLYYLELATREGNYGLEEESQEPDQYVQTFNADLIMCEELLAKSLPKDEIEFIFSGLSHLISHILISNVTHLKDLNYYGSRKMIRNILALQQNLTSISLTTETSGLDHALKYYELFQLDLDAVMHQVTEHDLVFTLEEYQFLLRFVYQNAERQLEIDSDQYELNYRKYKEAQRVVESMFKNK